MNTQLLIRKTCVRTHKKERENQTTAYFKAHRINCTKTKQRQHMQQQNIRLKHDKETDLRETRNELNQCENKIKLGSYDTANWPSTLC